MGLNGDSSSRGALGPAAPLLDPPLHGGIAFLYVQRVHC
jgi:hypothetical protein